MENIYTVYRLIFPNKKFYIGKTKLNPEKRWRKGKGYQGQEKVYSAIQEFGWDNIQKEIIADKLTKKEAEDLEAQYIREGFCNQNIYNEVHGIERLEQNLKESLKRITEKEKIENEKIRQGVLYADEIRSATSRVRDIIGSYSARKTEWLCGKEGSGITPEEEERLKKKLLELKEVCLKLVNLNIE